jgi:hypothetical protein
MGGDIVDMTLNELIDVKAVFGKLDAARIANLMSEGQGHASTCARVTARVSMLT